VDISKLLRERINAALAASESSEGGTNIAISANVGKSGSSTSVYSDDDVTIIERDGETQVIRTSADADAEPQDFGS
jgi:hypothetical protein